MRHLVAMLGVVLIMSVPAMAQDGPSGPQEQTGDRLPVKRVVLYKNGVGFFEHLGRVKGSQQLTIDFTGGQLNDVLKSLTAVDLGNGKVTGVSFNTDDPASRRLSTLSLPLDEETNVLAFLGAMRGARVQVQAAAGTIVGRILAVESRHQDVEGKAVEVRDLSVITDDGELRTVELSQRTSVRMLEGDLRGDVRRYLDIVASTRQRDLRRMTIATSGSGERQLFVSYISEVPIWKSTYRLVLPAKATDKPLLQGWAIVDNTIGEDWSDVELSLVAGSPQSFIQQLSQPLYARRPVVPLPAGVQLTPQTHDETLSEETSGAGVAEAELDAAPTMKRLAMAPPPPAPSMAPMAAPMAARDMAMEAVAKVEAAAEGHELGDLFEYRLKEPVTIRKNQSALVPIVSGTVDAERVSLWNDATGNRPRAAVWLTNSTAFTLDGGAFSVLDGATFTGEGLMDAVKPGEKRLLTYAQDSALLVSKSQDARDPERVLRVRVQNGTLFVQREYRDRRTYTVRNEDTRERMLIIEHPNRAGWGFTNAVSPAETTISVHRFRVNAAPRATSTLVVEEKRVAESTYLVSNVSDDLMSLMEQQRVLTPELQTALKSVSAKKYEIVVVSSEIDGRNREYKRIVDEQVRLRENIKALGDRAEEKALVSRYVRELGEQEDRLALLKREVQEREARRQKLQAELDGLIQTLSVSTK